MCCKATKLRDEITKVRAVLAKTEDRTPESIKQATSEMQKTSLKLFEMAYRKASWYLVQGECSSALCLTDGK